MESGALPFGEVNTNSPSAIHSRPEPLPDQKLAASACSISDVFLHTIPIMLLALVEASFLAEIPLRTTSLILQGKTADAIIDESAPITVH